MLLVYSLKTTQRISYIFKHICTRILGIEVGFTSQIEEFISYTGPKLSYGKIPLGNEFFIQSYGLLNQQGFDDVEIIVKEWEGTKGFFSVGKLSVLPFDIFSASFFLLSRYEEYLPHVKDEKGRFLASESIAFKEGFLQEPIVDIWAYKLKNLLSEAFPGLQFPLKTMKVHTLVNAIQPFAYKNKGFLRSFSGYIKDISKLNFKAIWHRTSALFGLKEDPFNTFNWLIENVKNLNNKITVFFLIGASVNFDEGINSKRKVFKLLVKNIADYKEVGIIFSKDSLNDITILKDEKEQIETITNRSLLKAMNNDYLVSLPENYRNLIELEIKEDFTMVYENVPGFRASTCTPFLFYDLDYEIVTPLLITPIAATTTAFRNVNKKFRMNVFNDLLSSVRKVNGNYSIIFTNKDFSITEQDKVWKTMFSIVSEK